MADRVSDLSGYTHEGNFWTRSPESHFSRKDRANPCYLCGWGPSRGIHGVPAGTEPHDNFGLHSFRSHGPKIEPPAAGMGEAK